MYSNRSLSNNIGQGRTGIDKIKLFTRDYSIRDKYVFAENLPTRKPGQVEQTKPWGMDSKGNTIAGKLYHNDGLINVNIDEFGFKVHFNPSKHYHPFYLNADDTLLNESLKMVEARLKGLGISFYDFNDLTLSRVDPARQSFMNHSVDTYINTIVNKLKAKRMRERLTYDRSALIKNDSFQIGTYDKMDEHLASILKADGKTDEYIKLSQMGINNMMRAELRLTKADSVKRWLGISKVGHLKECGLSYIDDMYVKAWGDKVKFPTKENLQSSSILSQDDYISAVAEITDTHKRGVAEKLVMRLLFQQVSSECIDLQKIEYAFKYLNFPRSTTHSRIEQIREIISNFAFYQNEASVYDLLHEYRERFAA